MIAKPVLPIIASLIAMLLPILANLITLLLPILADLIPVACRALSPKTIIESVTPLFGSPSWKLAGAGRSVSQPGQCGRPVPGAIA
jgi:hypothetical protein